MMNHDAVEARLREDEGYDLNVYPDTRGNLTAGIGHKIQPNDFLKLGDTVTPQRVENWFSADYAAAVAGATAYPWCGQLNDARQQLIVCLEFNMGPHVFGEFHDTQASIAAGDFDAAANGLLSSAWAGEVGYLKYSSRGATYARILRTGIWE